MLLWQNVLVDRMVSRLNFCFWGSLHHGEGGVVAGDSGEVVLQHGQGAGQRHVATAAEQRHAWEAEDGGHQRGVGHPAQTFDAALEASCRGRQRGWDGLFNRLIRQTTKIQAISFLFKAHKVAKCPTANKCLLWTQPKQRDETTPTRRLIKRLSRLRWWNSPQHPLAFCPPPFNWRPCAENLRRMFVVFTLVSPRRQERSSTPPCQACRAPNHSVLHSRCALTLSSARSAEYYMWNCATCSHHAPKISPFWLLEGLDKTSTKMNDGAGF